MEQILTEPKLSKSGISTYESCPYQYKLKYIHKFKPTPSPIMQRGSDIHQLCEDFFVNGETFEESVEYLLQKQEAHKYKVEMKNFLMYVKELQKQGYGRPLMQEKKFYNEEWNFTLIADAIFENDKGELLLLDYKTGKNKGVANHRFELALYVFFMEKVLNRKIHKWGIVFLDDPNVETGLATEEVKNISITAAKKKILKTREQINNNIFPKKTKYGCQYCGYFGNGCNGV